MTDFYAYVLGVGTGGFLTAWGLAVRQLVNASKREARR